MDRNVTISKSTVVKTGDPAKMRVEAEKTRRAFALGQDSGLFRVPRVLDYDELNGILVLERLHDIAPTDSTLRHSNNCMQFLDTLGRCVAAIHAGLVLPKEMRVPLPEEFALDSDVVYLHGDLSVKNILVGSGRPSIAILDWQMTEVHGGTATCGTPYFDVMWVVNNLFFFLCRQRLWFSRTPDAALAARRFIRSYVDAAQPAADCEAAEAYMRRFFDFTLAHRRSRTHWTQRIFLANAFSQIQQFTSAPGLTT